MNVDRLRELFTKPYGMAAPTEEQWRELYDENVRFKDPTQERQGIKAYSDWPPIPQLYVKGEFVGGSDIMMEMFEAGELQQMMDAKAVAKAEG